MKPRSKMRLPLFSLFAWTLIAVPLFAGVHERGDAPETVVYEAGKALPAQIHVPADPDPQVVDAVKLLCRVLSQMTETDWKTITYARDAAPDSGLVINDALAEFPIPDAENADQGFVISSNGKKIEIASIAPLGIVHGTAAFARELGYRRFFGSKRWEHFPQREKIDFATKMTESPDFCSRDIRGARLPKEKEDANEYHWANLHGGEVLDTGHMYGRFMSARKAIFETHPEYYALNKGGRRTSGGDLKPCISNPGLRAEMVAYIRDCLKRQPEQNSVSMDPSDGGNWCECEECAKMGSVTTQMITMTNEAARMIREEFPGKKIGIYAYNQHSPPPEIQVEPEIVVSIATAFFSEGWTYERLVPAWRKKGVKQFGVRDYHDVVIWSDWWTPGRAKASNTQYCTEELKNYYDGGARYFRSEGGWVFAPYGLGYYLSLRTLWNVEEAARKDKWVRDFLEMMFGPAAEAMGQYYELVDGKNKPLLSEDLLGRMYRYLSEAFRTANGDPAVTRRIADIALYARHCELLLAMRMASTPASQQEFLQHAARVHTDQIFSHPNVRRLAARVLSGVAATIDWDNPGAPYTIQEIATMVESGAERNKLLSFTPINYTDEYRPFPIEGTKRFDSLRQRGRKNYYTFVTDPTTPITLTLTGGLIYQNRGNVRVELYQIGGGSETGERVTLICMDDSTPPDKQSHSVSLRAKGSGLYKIVVDDGSDMTKIEWLEGTPMVIDAGHPESLHLQGSGGFYFYIPPGTKQLGFYTRCNRGGIYNSFGEEVFKFTSDASVGHFDITVPASEGGKLWSYRGGGGIFSLLTVPPLAALSGDEMMLPIEVIPTE